jgi:hypothetical protein
MSLEFGPVPPVQPSGTPVRPAQPRRVDVSALGGWASAPEPADTGQLLIPASPPPEVLDEVGVAAERAAALWDANRELHFSKDEDLGRIVIEARDRDGNVLRTIAAAEMLEVMAGRAL